MKDEALKEEVLEELKILKGIDDDLQDPLLKLVIKQAMKAILSRINRKRKKVLTEVPLDLDWVVLEVATKRFNRLDSEGTTKHSREGEDFDWDNYLDEYELDLERHFDDDDKEDKSRKGVLRIWG